MTAPATPAASDRQRIEALLAGAGFFILIYALTQLGLILWFRAFQAGLYVPGRLVCLCAALITAVAFAPFLLPEDLRDRIGDRLYLYPLLCFGLMLTAWSGMVLGGAAPTLVLLYAALGLAGLVRAMPRLRGLSSAHLALLPLAVAFAVYVFYYFNQWNYAGVFMPEYALLGRLRKDGYFAAVIAHMIQNHGVSSIGADGLVRLHYHVGSHTWFAGLGHAAGTMPLMTYPFAHQIVLLPAQLLALLLSIICAAGHRRSLAAYAAAALVMVFVTDAIGRPSHYVSESYAFGVTALLFFWPLMHDLIRRPDRGRDLTRPALALLGVFLISSFKISAGILWTTALGWTMLRRHGLKPAGLAVIGFAAALILAALKVFSDPGQAAILAPLKFFRSHPRLLFLGCWIIPGLYLAALAGREGIVSRESLRRAFSERRTLAAEVIILMALVGAAPATLLWLSNAWAWFFFNLTQWPAMSLLVAEWDFRLPAPPRQRRAFLAATTVAALLALAAGVRFFSHNFTTAYLHGAAEFAGNGQYVSKSGDPGPTRPYGMEIERLLASAPGYRAYTVILDAAQGRDGKLAVHVPASNRKYWTIVGNCEAQPMFGPAVTGVPMLYGLLPQDQPCDLAFYGYPDYGPDAYARDLDPDALCRHAREHGFTAVFELADLDRPEANRVIECPANPAGQPR